MVEVPVIHILKLSPCSLNHLRHLLMIVVCASNGRPRLYRATSSTEKLDFFCLRIKVKKVGFIRCQIGVCGGAKLQPSE